MAQDVYAMTSGQQACDHPEATQGLDGFPHQIGTVTVVTIDHGGQRQRLLRHAARGLARQQQQAPQLKGHGALVVLGKQGQFARHPRRSGCRQVCNKLFHQAPVAFRIVHFGKQGHGIEGTETVRLVTVEGARMAVEHLAQPGGAGAGHAEQQNGAQVHVRAFREPPTTVPA
jgi:hypothetical protein